MDGPGALELYLEELLEEVEEGGSNFPVVVGLVFSCGYLLKPGHLRQVGSQLELDTHGMYLDVRP